MCSNLKLNILFLFVFILSSSIFCQHINYKIADAHIHNGFIINNNSPEFFNFDFFNDRGIEFISFPFPIDRSADENILEVVASEVPNFKLFVKSNNFHLITNSSQTDSISNNELKVFFSLESFDGPFNGNPENVFNYRKLGIRYITLIPHKLDKLFDNNKLTDFGKKIITNMNSAGVVADITHLNEKQMIEVINYSKKPVIASHSCSQTVTNDSFNVSDKVLNLLKLNKGYVFVSFNKNGLINPASKKNGIEQYIDNIEYLVNQLGEDYVGIGSDYQAQGKYVPESLNKSNTYKVIANSLLKRGYSETSVNKIMCDNFLRLMK